MKRWLERPASQTPAADRDDLRLGRQFAQRRYPVPEAEDYARAIAARHVTVTGIAPIAALGLMLTAGAAQAAVINVTPAGAVDQTDNGNCSLIEAIVAANDNTAVDACPAGDDATGGGDTVNLPSDSTFTLTTALIPDTGLPLISSTVTLVGNGSTIERSSADGIENFRFLSVGIEGDLTLRNTTLSNGKTQYANGGAIFNDYGTVTLVNSTITGCTVEGADGGGIRNTGVLTLVDSVVSDNHVYDYDGGGDGGGIWNGGEGSVTLTNSTVSGNTADDASGGGIFNDNGTFDLINSTVSGNTADVGGGISNRSTVSLTSSTVSGNTAKYGGGGIESSFSALTLTLTNSTVSGNTTGGLGGGIFAKYATVTLTSSTITGNTANSSTGGLYVRYSTVTLDNTIIATQLAGSDCSGFESTFTETDTNLDSDDTCFLESTPDDPLLLPLAYNGGPTQTHALCTGLGEPVVGCEGTSPALDANSECSVATDQRGVARPQDGNGSTTAECDIGAYEELPAGTTFDFGDAPDPPYPTMLSSGGAQHILTEGFMLGTTVTEETDSLPSDTGDDGVTFPTPLVAGSSIMLNVTVTDSAMGCEASSCRLDAWVDYNGDGDWNDEGEQIADSQIMAVGTNAVPVEVPTTLGITIAARFRLSRAGDLLPTGLANDGEVEDYVVRAPSSSSGGGGGGDSCDSWELFGWCIGIGAADHWTLLLIGLLGLWRRLRYPGGQSG